MNTLKVLYNSIFLPLEVINQKKAEGKLLASCIVVFLAAFSGSVILPTMYYLAFRDRYDLSLEVSNIFIMFCMSALTWLAECMLFRLLSLLFKKEVNLKEIVSTWGLSYTPNVLCITAYTVLLLKPGVFIGNGIVAFIINTFFIMLLIWKAIYYFMQMKYVMKTTAIELLIITIVTGITFVFLMMLGSAVGIQVPML